MRVRAFQAWRPPADLVSKVASLPYDVVDTAEARALSAGNPSSFFHVSRAEIDLPDGTDPQAAAVYAKAADNFAAFQKQGILAKDPAPGLYLYRLIRGEHAQRGIVGVCHVEDYENNVIRKHEKTRKIPEDDRTRHVTATNAHSGPVFLAYRDQPQISSRVTQIEQLPPLYDFVAPDKVRHTVWKIDPADALVIAFDRVPAAYIADGHHRAAAAARVARERRAANALHTGHEEYNWFLAVLFPASELQILPYNRCVKDLNGQSETSFLDVAAKSFEVAPAAASGPVAPGQISMYLGGKWLGLSWEPDPGADPVAALDVSVLQDRLLSPILGIDDPRNNPRIEFVGGIRGTNELKNRVNSGRAAVAFSMHPTTVEQLMAISDAGQTMPPKSTWFEPKLRDGLLVHTLD
jgi:uncharacterized protein (DUF1015 family)